MGAKDASALTLGEERVTKRYRLPQVFTDDPDRLAATRRCGPCTACCIAPSLPVLGCKPLDCVCAHLRRGRAKTKRPGCRIYDARPEHCRSYVCYWRMGMLGKHERPDRLGIIFDTNAPEMREVIAAAGVSVVLARETYPGSSKNTLAKAAILAMTKKFGVVRVGIPNGPIVHADTVEITDKITAAIIAVGKTHP